MKNTDQIELWNRLFVMLNSPDGESKKLALGILSNIDGDDKDERMYFEKLIVKVMESSDYNTMLGTEVLYQYMLKYPDFTFKYELQEL